MTKSVAEIANYTLQDLRKDESESVFVLNNSRALPATKNIGGDVILSVHTLNGTPETVTIPLTWIPYDISMVTPKDTLLKSMEFLRALSKNILTLVSPSDAESILATDKAKGEISRLQETQVSLVTKDEIDNNPGNNIPVKVLTEGDLNQEEAVVNPQVLDVMSRDDVTDDSRHASIVGLENYLNKDDWNYIIAQPTASAETKELASQNLQD